jgi:hypothetical protein
VFIFHEEAHMKKVMVVAVVVASLVIAGAAFAGQARNNTGCGLGSMLFQNNADNSVVLQTFQATTNGIYGNQTFGITTGTSECSQPKNFVTNERVNEFMVANMDNLAKDIAQGRGPTLDAFAELMGVPADQRAEFAGKLQASFGKIYSSHDVQMAGVMDSIANVSK